MSSVIECFTYLKENGVIQELVLGYDTTKNAIGRGTIIFDREYQSPMIVRDVLYFPRLKKKLISIFTIEDRGVEVIFKREQVLIYPTGSNITLSKVIGIIQGNLVVAATTTIQNFCLRFVFGASLLNHSNSYCTNPGTCASIEIYSFHVGLCFPTWFIF